MTKSETIINDILTQAIKDRIQQLQLLDKEGDMISIKDEIKGIIGVCSDKGLITKESFKEIIDLLKSFDD